MDRDSDNTVKQVLFHAHVFVHVLNKVMTHNNTDGLNSFKKHCI